MPTATDRERIPPTAEAVRKVRSSAFRRKFVILAKFNLQNFRLKAELRTFRTVSAVGGIFPIRTSMRPWDPLS